MLNSHCFGDSRRALWKRLFEVSYFNQDSTGIITGTEIVLFHFEEKDSKEDGGKLMSFLTKRQVKYQVHI